ncbi:unnamed protein product [Amoebophrya sp. A120]|nr:unnamed protein product [Amoebophrya sp. A120]|eukprot:GSA120T00022602001.1
MSASRTSTQPQPLGMGDKKAAGELGSGHVLFAGNTKLASASKRKMQIADTEENATKLEASLNSLESIEEQKATAQGALSQKMLQALASSTPESDLQVDEKTQRVSLSKAGMLVDAGENFTKSLLPPAWCEEWELNLPDYPRIDFPQKKTDKWSLDTLLAMVQHFKTNPAQPLHPLLIMRLLNDAEIVMSKKYHHAIHRATIPKKSMEQKATDDNKEGLLKGDLSQFSLLNKKAVATPGRTIVVGDTHGQLEDVLWIFYKNGLPSPSNAYLFNGDIADRGFYATEIFSMVLGFMLLYPNCVDMNRGNHEDETINLDPHCGGFYEENIQKYGGNIGSTIYESYLKIYSNLPLASVLEKRVFIVHGGLSRVTEGMLKVLSGIDHHVSSTPESPDNTADTVFIDAMWSDPMEGKGIVPSNRGPSLVQFGPDVTMKFLRQNGFHLVVRSHQPPSNKDGVFFHHDGRLITVFSASNYCGWYGNTGAVLIFSPGKGDTKAASLPTIEIVRHFSPTFDMLANAEITTNDLLAMDQMQARAKNATSMEHAAIKNSRQSLSQRMDKLIFEVKTRFARILVDNKQGLWKFWLTHEKEGDYNDNRSKSAPPGLITFDAWKEGISSMVGTNGSVLGGIPWQQIKEILSIEDPHTKLIDYPLSLHRFRVVIRDEIKSETQIQDVRKSVTTQSSLFPKKTVDASGNVMRHTNWMESILARLFETLLLENVPWQDLVKRFAAPGSAPASAESDDDDIPEIDMDTLQKVLCSLQKPGSSGSKTNALITKEQAGSLIRTLTGYGGSRHSVTNLKPSSISLLEFLSRLEVCYTGYNVQRVRQKVEAGIKEGPDAEQSIMNLKFGTSVVATSLRLIGQEIYAESEDSRSASKRTHKIFQEADKDQDGLLSKAEFLDVVDQLLARFKDFLQEHFLSSKSKYATSGAKKAAKSDLPLSLLEDIFKVVDVTRQGKVSYLEFLHCFQPSDRSDDTVGLSKLDADSSIPHLRHPAEEIRVALMEQICGFLYTNKQALHKIFLFFDKNNSHLIEKKNFVKAVKCLNVTISLKAPPLTNDQIEMLADHCVLNTEEQIDYLQFLNALVICDMRTGEMFD